MVGSRLIAARCLFLVSGVGCSGARSSTRASRSAAAPPPFRARVRTTPTPAPKTAPADRPPFESQRRRLGEALDLRATRLRSHLLAWVKPVLSSTEYFRW